ncbi:gluconokinase [Ensifer soli]|uniref:gluconokinase n=1 Tax=Ciceribacter sp. sgz301302 TaxID=3342379 RepID=UPI0035B93A81
MSTAASPPVFDGPVVVMGVSGSGKSSIGERIAAAWGRDFLEGDSLHPPANIEKMSAGIALTDADRWPWLATIGARLAQEGAAGIVVSCSALKRSYRDLLRNAAGRPLAFVYLKGTRAVLLPRMGSRPGHFMPASLLDSQLAALESPEGEENVVTVDVGPARDRVATQALEGLARLRDARRG